MKEHSNSDVVAAAIGLALDVGVVEWCVAAGARNAPLVTALANGAHGPVYHFFDERAAGFFALGRCTAEQRPIGIVVTSGTAVAELLPAVVEAHYSGQPLVVISADRPPRFRGSGAPQTINQQEIFGTYPLWATELSAQQLDSPIAPELPLVGPAHLNVCLEEPQPEQSTAWPHRGGGSSRSKPSSANLSVPSELEDFLASPENVMLIAGSLSARDGVRLGHLAEHWGIPLWAEAISNVPSNPWVLQCGEKLLGAPDWRPRKVLRFGGVPTCRFWRDLEELSEIEVLHCISSPYSGLARPSTVLPLTLDQLSDDITLHGDSCFTCLPDMLVADQALASARDTLLYAHPGSEPAWLHRILQSVGPTETLFLGNSLPIRESNLVRPSGSGVCYANRGANGIDGAISTFYGLCAETAGTAILGDLTALYDLSAPWILPQLPPHRRTVVVLNNEGGRIFSHLPSITSLPQAAQEMIENRHGQSLLPFAQAWGVSTLSCSQPEDWLAVLPDGFVEVLPDPQATSQFWQSWRATPVPGR